MKKLKNYLLESTQDEDLQEEIGTALRNIKAGNVKNGFNFVKKSDIEDALYKLGFDFDEEKSDDKNMYFYGEYIDSKYEVILYIDKTKSDEIKLKSFNVFEE